MTRFLPLSAAAAILHPISALISADPSAYVHIRLPISARLRFVDAVWCCYPLPCDTSFYSACAYPPVPPSAFTASPVIRSPPRSQRSSPSSQIARPLHGRHAVYGDPPACLGCFSKHLWAGTTTTGGEVEAWRGNMGRTRPGASAGAEVSSIGRAAQQRTPAPQ